MSIHVRSLTGVRASFAGAKAMSKWVSEPVMRPFCAKCAALLQLSRVDFDTKGREHRAYRCLSCGKTESVTAKARRIGRKAG